MEQGLQFPSRRAETDRAAAANSQHRVRFQMPQAPFPTFVPHRQRAQAHEVQALLPSALWWLHGFGPQGIPGSPQQPPLQPPSHGRGGTSTRGFQLHSEDPKAGGISNPGSMTMTVPMGEHSLWAGLHFPPPLYQPVGKEARWARLHLQAALPSVSPTAHP